MAVGNYKGKLIPVRFFLCCVWQRRIAFHCLSQRDEISGWLLNLAIRLLFQVSSQSNFYNVPFLFQVWFSNRRARLRKQVTSGNGNGYSNSSGMSMGLPVYATPTSSYGVLSSHHPHPHSLHDSHFAATPQSKNLRNYKYCISFRIGFTCREFVVLQKYIFIIFLVSLLVLLVPTKSGITAKSGLSHSLFNGNPFGRAEGKV